MRFQRVWYLTLWLSLPIALFAAQGTDVRSTSYATVTDERLEHPEDGDWLMYRRTYDGSGFSPLKQINTGNIGRLSLAWSLNTDLSGAHETTPIVNHGRMFITTPGNNVIGLDARTGTELWRYVKKYPEGLFQLHPTNRGVALYGDRVYMATTRLPARGPGCRHGQRGLDGPGSFGCKPRLWLRRKSVAQPAVQEEL